MALHVQHGTHTELLSIQDVASWQVALRTPGKVAKIHAALPALQRNAVWKPRQTEALWDSLVRGFPIGSFLVTPFNKARGIQPFKYGGGDNADYHLLDGQQRANAIALGFLDQWNCDARGQAALWVDLVAPDRLDDRKYVFRVLTRAHPWGYSKDMADKRLEVRNIRAALDAFKDASPELKGLRASAIPISRVWPWASTAPLPVAILLQAVINGGDPRKTMLESLSKLPFWGSDVLRSAEGDWKRKVLTALTQPNDNLYKRFGELVEDVRGVVLAESSTYAIPILVLHDVLSDHSDDQAQSSRDRKDPIETLFIRVNAGGTPLEGEELIYSILKSIWPEAPQAIERLRVRFMSPARLVVLVARLVLARTDKAKGLIPAIPDVARFRRLMHGMDSDCPDFEARLKESILEESFGAALFDKAVSVLTDKLVGYSLPSVLAADIARRAPDVLFLFLAWIQRMLDTKADPGALKDNARRKVLGMLTAFTWFASDPSKCAQVLWRALQACETEKLPDFFSRGNFEKTLALSESGSFIMLPLVHPDLLKLVVDSQVTEFNGGRTGAFSNPGGAFWRNWRWYDHFAGNTFPRVLGDWYEGLGTKLIPRHLSNENVTGEINAKYSEAWTQFIDKLRWERRVLLYAQRKFIRNSFEEYDSLSLDQAEDMERPWDYDHIHPENYVARLWNIPQVIKDWHSSIGNLRAWPMEANRAAGDSPPRMKMVPDTAEKLYGMEFMSDILDASILPKCDLDHWNNCTPAKFSEGDTEVGKGAWFPKGYLADPKEYGSCRQELVRAITTRFVWLYRIWYEELKIKQLMPIAR